MNDQHTHAGYAAHDGNTAGAYDVDPLFGDLPGTYEAGHSGQYDSTQWNAGAGAQHQVAGYDTAGYAIYATPQYGQQQHYDTSGQWPGVDAAGNPVYQQPDVTGQWDADAWNQANQATHNAHATQAAQFESAPFDGTQFGYDTPGHPATAQFDATQFQDPQAQNPQFEAAQFQQNPPFQNPQYGYDATAQWAAPVADTGAYDATAWNAAQDTLLAGALVPEQFAAPGYDGAYEAYQDHETRPGAEPEPQHESGHAYEADGGADTDADYDADHDAEPVAVHLAETTAMPTLTPSDAAHPVRRAPAGGNGSRGRRRTPSKRSALFTVAVPSACVMGVAGIAAASVGGLSGGDDPQDDTKSLAAADPGSVKPVAVNNKMDTQLAALSADARDFGDRASRTQERIDLKERKEAEKKKRDAEAARKEAARPKFVLPVKEHGLSAYFGQAGVNWMSVHTGIDFPVQYGTSVMAATDGTVRTQWNSAYGNMAIVTSPDGTETWYCHLSSTKIRSGSVKAGDVIAYSGNSGNSTGPHMHFEVRPGAGAAIDPLPWLRSHGLNPE